MQLASQLSSRVLIINLRDLPEGPDSPQWPTVIDVLQRLSTTAMRLGLQLAAQTGEAPLSALQALVGELPERAIGFDLHPAQLIAAGVAPLEFIQAVGPAITHVHAADAVRDLAAGRAVEVQLGRGTAEFPELLGSLEEFSYQGWITIERSDSANPVEETATAVEYLEAVIRG